jgi:hypothetical protein
MTGGERGRHAGQGRSARHDSRFAKPVLKSGHGERTNAGRRRTLAGRTAARRSREIEKRAEAHSYAAEKAKTHWLDIEIAKLAAEFKRVIEN